MKILMLTGYFWPRIGGVEKHVLRVSEELVELGHEVTVLTRRWDPGWPEQQDRRGVRVRRADGGISKAPRDPHLRLLGEADVIHCHDAYPYLRFYLPARFARKTAPFVTFHGYEGYPIPRTARWLRRRLAKRAAGTICMGEFIRHWYGHECDVVSYGGVDAPQGRVPDADPAAPALYVGRLAPDTTIMGYLEALRLLRQRGRDVRFVVCGEGPLSDKVVAVARAADVDVVMRGWITDVAPELDQCRFAFVSGYLSILEAMAQRRLACSLYDNPLKRDYLELFPAAQHMVIADGPDRLASAIEEQIENPSAATATIDAAEAYAREQTWRKVAELYLDLYRQRGVTR
ncbi:MAG: glycosyltransferase family 4 protein [Armatimonadota bacterium]|nr:MAG: glycosyltransferase family 4 protein [Armatimonadota bacterium]